MLYYQNKLEGVTGIDITLKKFIDSFLNIDLPFRLYKNTTLLFKIINGFRGNWKKNLI